MTTCQLVLLAYGCIAAIFMIWFMSLPRGNGNGE